MEKRPALQLPAPVSVRLLALTMTFVISGLGLLALVSGHTEERWTRYGHTGSLEGAPAHAFGLAMFFFGLLPLALAMRTPKSAMWWAVSAVVLGLLTVFVGPALLA
ncbi:hypothetical protein [Lysobacter sp. HA35]